MTTKTILLLITVIFLLQSVSASYISGDIYLYENGYARFNIETDIPIQIENLNFQNNKLTGTTESLNSKQNTVWTFTLNRENYDSILIDIHLPKNLASITAIKGNEHLIDFNKKTITIIDSGALNFQTSYKLKPSENTDLLIFSVVLISAIVILILLFRLLLKRKKKKYKTDTLMSLLNEQEQKIIDALMPYPKRQKQLRTHLNIPKASFSRYISNLEKKKLIIKEGEGKNKILKLK